MLVEELDIYKQKILEHDLDDTQAWIDHVSTYYKFAGIVGAVVAAKVQACLNRMKDEHENLTSGKLDNNLTDEEIVNICINRSGYKNRIQRDSSSTQN